MKRKIVDFMTFICCLAVSCLSLASCDSELDVQQEYPFTVESMPVVGKIADGETVEIRLEIKAEGNFSGTVYTLRYFQPDGKGSLKMEDGTVLKPNDRYLLNELRFRLYYTSLSDDQSSLKVWVEDWFGQAVELEFSYNNDNSEKERDSSDGLFKISAKQQG